MTEGFVRVELVRSVRCAGQGVLWSPAIGVVVGLTMAVSLTHLVSPPFLYHDAIGRGGRVWHLSYPPFYAVPKQSFDIPTSFPSHTSCVKPVVCSYFKLKYVCADMSWCRRNSTSSCNRSSSKYPNSPRWKRPVPTLWSLSCSAHLVS